MKNDHKDTTNVFNNFKNTENQHFKGENDGFIDKDIYEKFLMFLQFQEEMKKRN